MTRKDLRNTGNVQAKQVGTATYPKNFTNASSRILIDFLLQILQQMLILFHLLAQNPELFLIADPLDVYEEAADIVIDALSTHWLVPITLDLSLSTGLAGSRRPPALRLATCAGRAGNSDFGSGARDFTG